MNTAVLIADRDEKMRDALKHILCGTYQVFAAGSLNDVHRIIEAEHSRISAVIIDLSVLKGTDTSLIKDIKSSPLNDDVPIFIVCTFSDIATILNFFNEGITDFIFKPFDKDVILQRLKTFIDIYRGNLDRGVFGHKSERLTVLFGDVVHARSLESSEHIQRVKKLTRIIAEDIKKHYPQYALSDRDVDNIVSASAMHDVGKILIPDDILLKPTKLTPNEFEVMKTHTTKGCELLEEARGIWGDEYTDICKDIALYHHERYDGNGYPYGLKGNEIPISAQIVSIADVYDALINQRVYKAPVIQSETYNMIISGQCGKFSDILLDSFKRQIKNLEEISENEKK
ncbi:MAG: HD domain-containing protein [Clostridia bacterium]|nr:HD domain-containing protein [Clostridia bacterium]